MSTNFVLIVKTDERTNLRTKHQEGRLCCWRKFGVEAETHYKQAVKSSLLYISTNREEFMSLYCKTKIITPLMYKVLGGVMMKSEMPPHLSVAKRGYVLGSASVGSYSIRSLQVERLAANGRLLLRVHGVPSVGRGSMPCNRLHWR